ncbi:SulP family inorganic anion transporter [Snodgrassella alvi]|nr:SulP family inorganic anion transporter [Snodgrassella alvi]
MGTKLSPLLRFSNGWILLGYVLPMALACAGIAGLPISMALTGVMCALLCSVLFCGREKILLTPSPFSALMLMASVAYYAGAVTERVAVASMLTLFTGVWLLLLAMVLPRHCLSWIPRPVWHGIGAGIVLTLVVMLVPIILGVSANSSSWLEQWELLVNWQRWNWPSMVLAGLTLALLVLWRTKSQPKVLWVLLLVWILSHIWPFSFIGIATPVQQSWQLWPLFHLMHADWPLLIFLSATIALLIYVEVCQYLPDQFRRGIGIAGLSNILAAMTGGMVVSVGYVADRSVKIRVNTLMTTLLLLALIYCWSWWPCVPLPVLAVIALYIICVQISWGELRLYYRQWDDLLWLCASAILIILFGIYAGLWLVISLGLIVMCWHSLRMYAWPVLLPEVQIMAQEAVIILPQVLLFANACMLLQRSRDLVNTLNVQKVYLDVSAGCCADVTVFVHLQALARELHQQDKMLFVCGLSEKACLALIAKKLDYLLPEQFSTRDAESLLICQKYMSESLVA